MADSDYYNTLLERINNVPDCNSLQELTAEISAIIAKQLASIQESLDSLLPLLTIPGLDLGEIVDWITAAVATYAQPYASLLALQADIIAKQAELLAAIQAKLDELDC